MKYLLLAVVFTVALGATAYYSFAYGVNQVRRYQQYDLENACSSTESWGKKILPDLEVATDTCYVVVTVRRKRSHWFETSRFWHIN